MTAVVCLSVLGVLGCAAVMATITLCYLKRPEKTPVALVSMSIIEFEYQFYCECMLLKQHINAGSCVQLAAL